MQQSELNTSAPGELISYGRKSYYNPDPLPPSRDLTLGNDFYETLSDATFWLGKLSGVSLELDFPPVLYASLLRKEAMESAEIEGQILTTTRSTASKHAHSTLAKMRLAAHLHRAKQRTRRKSSTMKMQSRMESRHSTEAKT